VSDDKRNLREQFEPRTTEELIAILRNHDDGEWRQGVFDVVASILKARGISPDEIVALGPEGYSVAELEPTQTIAHFFSPPEAHASRMALEEAGIAAWVADEAGGTMYGVGIGTRLQVRARDVRAAREVLSSALAPVEGLPPDRAEPGESE
jgi:Putative prokaryotic signal transducing protein